MAGLTKRDAPLVAHCVFIVRPGHGFFFVWSAHGYWWWWEQHRMWRYER